MRNHIFRLLYLVFAGASVAGEYFLITTFSPQSTIALAVISLPILIVFFFLLFCLSFFVTIFFTRSMLQGILVGMFVCIYFLFRYAGLVKILYQILLLLIFISVELFFHQKKRERRDH